MERTIEERLDALVAEVGMLTAALYAVADQVDQRKALMLYEARSQNLLDSQLFQNRTELFLADFADARERIALIVCPTHKR